MAFEMKDIVPHVITFLGGGIVKIFFDYMTNRDKVKAEVQKILAEAEKIKVENVNKKVETANAIALRETEYAMRVSTYNEENIKKYHALYEDYDKKRKECEEKDKTILRLTLELEKCQHEKKRISPDDDRDRGRRMDIP